MKFTAEEARAVTIEAVSKEIGEERINKIIQHIRYEARNLKTNAAILLSEYDIGDNYINLVVKWCNLNGYRVCLTSARVLVIQWQNPN